MAKPDPTRRQILQTGTAAASIAAAAGTFANRAHAVGDDTLKLALIGTGGRGSGAAVQALQADPKVELIAMADVFADRIEGRHKAIKGNGKVGDRVKVPNENRFVGLDAYKKAIDLADVVILTTPPGFRPAHIEYAVEKGKHIFAEKPVATDGPGLRRVIAACKKAAEKKLSVVSGLCYRYDTPKVELMKRIHDGALGKIQTLQTTYNGGTPWHRGFDEKWSTTELMLRNWLFYTWLSGDHVVEQAVHGIDKIAWAMQDKPPATCRASGGRTIRTDAKYGNIFDHFNAEFAWEDGTKGFHSSRQWDGKGIHREVSDFAFGTKGTAAIQGHRISGENEWRMPRGRYTNMYQQEHNELFASIRKGKPINNAGYMCNSTLMAMMVRMSAYTGAKITAKQALESKEQLVPENFKLSDNLPIRPVSVPGKHLFV